jgi:hypothetical protein
MKLLLNLIRKGEIYYFPAISLNVPTFLPLHIKYLTGNGPHRKHRVQNFFYSYLCIRCSWYVFTEPLSSNVRGTHIYTQTYRQQRDLVNLLPFLQNKESSLKNKGLCDISCPNFLYDELLFQKIDKVRFELYVK